MAVLYIDEYGATIRLSGERVEVAKDGSQLGSVRLQELECVVVQENCALTSAALAALLRLGITTAFISRHGTYLGRLQPIPSKNSGLRRAQYALSENVDYCLAVSRRLVAAKLANMRTLVMRFARRGNLDLRKSSDSLKQAALGAGAAKSFESLLGHEGVGTHAYFEALRYIVPPAFGFTGRNRRPPLDPFNAMLGFGYALLENLVERAVGIVGLDPFCGFLHKDSYGRQSLVLDLMEEFRPVVADSVVIDCCSRGMLDPASDFESRDGGIYLNAAGRKKFFKAFHGRAKEKVKPDAASNPVDYAEICVIQARKIADCIARARPDYKPFLIK